jgi:hypothetical protein
MKALFATIVFFTLQTVAYAEEPSASSLERLLEVTQAQRMTETIVQQVKGSMRPMFEQAIGARKLAPEERRKADQFMARFAEKMDTIMADELSWTRMKAFTIEIYREAFTQNEVNDLIAFYESPSGKAFVSKMPVVTQKSIALMQQRMVPMMERIEAAAKETVAEFQKQQALVK